MNIIKSSVLGKNKILIFNQSFLHLFFTEVIKLFYAKLIKWKSY